MPNYTVKQGDCISSIAQRYGLFWEKVWNHSKNAKLKEKRKDPNVLFSGDIVFVPDREENQESGATGQRHRFRLKGVPGMLRLRFLENDQPRVNDLYVLEIDGELFSGTTDAEGKLEHVIPPNAKRGILLLGEEQDEYVLDLGHVDPIDEISGVQERLENLGFDCGEVDGNMSPETQEALKEFQEKHGLQVTGQADQQTRAKLQKQHGC